MCNTPVTLGGGITTVYGFRPSGLELNSLCSIQYLYHLLSTFSELYLLANSILIESMLYLLFLLLYIYKGNDGRSRIHRQEKFFIVSRCLHSLLHLAHGFNGVHVCDVFAQNPHAIERLLVLEQIVTTRA